ncbi:MAG: chemotaxis-specific protein-glutamate methyltransferase CheB [Alphaproteobacteria bacterium]|jgi:two-component system chemotaxis response regulator CheB|nr:chemotaxis-specific protein-glutamate methyltransferase CheB [Alphaproteobacteria bacterium]
MVVDDSAVIRGLFTRTLEADPEIRVVSSVPNGQMAVNAIARQPVDVVILDIEMPVMDGLTALPKLLEASPASKVVMASTLTKRNAEISLKALEAGASEYVTKPTAVRELHSAAAFKEELLAKVKALGAATRPGGKAAARAPLGPRPAAPRTAAPREARIQPVKPGAITLRPMPSAFHPDIIAIGSSTGGPQALFKLLGHLAAGVSQPIIVTQHMPATFTTILAEHIGRQCRLPTCEAADGMPLVGGHCYVAPGNFHMVVAGKPDAPVLRINQDPPENFCRPAVDVMIRSVVAAFGRKVLAVILTGMGQDGLKGCRQVAEAGGVVVAQDEATSVVWGMPGAVASAGLCQSVLPIQDIGPLIHRLARKSAA